MDLSGLENLPEILQSVSTNELLEVEIGCGNGHFLAEYCEKKQSSFLIGIELKKKRCMKAQMKIERKALTNAAVIRCRAEEFIKRIPASLVDQYHIYFPDPWPKTKHRKRRFMRMFNLELVYCSLKKRGLILFTTDFFDYYLQTKLLFLLHPGLKISDKVPPEETFISIYGKKFTGMGKEIYTIAARKI